jgi:SsrA-binding protein
VAEKKRIEIPNKKAGFNFHIEDKYQAGMMLLGTEVKSIRALNINMGDAYCYFADGELFIRNMHISEYKQSSFGAHDPLRERKLLLSKRELKKLELKSKNKGYTIFPIRLFENERGIFKLEIAIGQGKKLFDKRDDLKEKDAKREIKNAKF